MAMMGERPTLATEDPAFLRAWNIDETSRYLIDRGYSKPTLQFPDEMLGNAAKVAVTLQTYCAERGHTIQVGKIVHSCGCQWQCQIS